MSLHVNDDISGNLIGASESLRLPQASSVENENSGEPGCARSSLICSHFDGTFFGWPMAFGAGLNVDMASSRLGGNVEGCPVVRL